MSVKISHSNNPAIWSLKIMYYYAKIFGLVFFKIDDSGRLRTSVKLQLYSVTYRLLGLIGYAYFLPKILMDYDKIQQVYTRVIVYIQIFSVAIFGFVFITFQIVQQKQFISVVNRTTDIFNRISKLSKNPDLFGREFHLVVISRIASNALSILIDLPRFIKETVDFIDVVRNFLSYILWVGTLIVVDLLCLGYITSSTMYRNIGNHLTTLAHRIEKSENRPMSKFRRMQVLCDFSEELDQCSAIYSDIFKVTREFHELFQINVLFVFHVAIILLISCIHQSFLIYISAGHIAWNTIVLGMLVSFDFLSLMLVIDLAVRRSRIPIYLNWDTLQSDIEDRWDRSVDQFLHQLKLESLSIDVYNLFQLNNELCLRIFSMIVAYLTILIQFSMLGYFKDDL